ncbi:LON peptidase substrate-binding domain-containing protein [Streptoalloteichus hindustanus]|uniref:Lon N-terminal domain-containing protein n=1 Tax=Streptoalloteichus hindustanus TaxID=2017 RepID=A0A1M5AS49_STRHI|nr:LON peptidase substrate-binding domain-containing protein [Streptoalloteichus hindustanus]SHF32927.1 hypothetical protein SAMN05444320_103235 [Streptoalloteichus hindustanus]
MAETLPLFPLGTVLLPGASLPLHVFEPRYRQLTVDLMTEVVPDRRFGVVAIRQGWEVGADNIESLHGVGCSATLREARRLPDGRFDVVALGERRFRLLDVDADAAPYLVGTVEWLPDSTPEPEIDNAAPALAEAARAAHRRYCAIAWSREDWREPPPETEPGDLAHLLAADCLLSTEDRQRLLEQTCPVLRLRLIRRVLARESGLLGMLRAVPAPVSDFAELPSRN